MEENYPELGEFAVIKVKKILPFGAICSLEEYSGLEAFVHISEVSSGWIRNIREHLKEGQLLVAKVVNIDRAKHQIDLSVKRVGDSDKKRKLLQYQSAKRAGKLLERAAGKLGKTLNQAYAEAGDPIIAEYGDIYSAFEALSQGEELKAKIPKAWLPVLTEIAKQEIREKKISARALITLQSFASDGFDQVKRILLDAAGQKYEAAIKMHYVSAPHYYVDVVAPDYKTADKVFAKIEARIAEQAKPPLFTFSLEKQQK